jgi:hypothetical protein
METAAGDESEIAELALTWFEQTWRPGEIELVKGL